MVNTLTGDILFENTDKEKEFKAKFDELSETHKEAIDIRKSQLEDKKKLLQTEVDMPDWYIIKKVDVPNDIGPELFGVIDFIEDK